MSSSSSKTNNNGSDTTSEYGNQSIPPNLRSPWLDNDNDNAPTLPPPNLAPVLGNPQPQPPPALPPTMPNKQEDNSNKTDYKSPNNFESPNNNIMQESKGDNDNLLFQEPDDPFPDFLYILDNSDSDSTQSSTHKSSMPTPVTQSNIFQTWSGHTVTPSLRVQELEEKFGSINPDFTTKTIILQAIESIRCMLPDSTFNWLHPWTYVMSLANQDTLTFLAAMKQPDQDKFIVAMEKEVANHIKRNHWKIVTMDEMHCTGHHKRPINAVWSFKHKCNPFRLIVKYKAQLCAHGGQT